MSGPYETVLLLMLALAVIPQKRDIHTMPVVDEVLQTICLVRAGGSLSGQIAIRRPD